MYQILIDIDNQQVFKGEACLDKCCRGSKVLQMSDAGKLECVDGSNHSEWSDGNLQLELGLDSLNVRSSFFYLKRNPKVDPRLYILHNNLLSHRLATQKGMSTEQEMMADWRSCWGTRMKMRPK